MVSPGNEPPPATASVSTTFTAAIPGGTDAATASARARSSSTGIVAIRQTGIDVASPDR